MQVCIIILLLFFSIIFLPSFFSVKTHKRIVGYIYNADLFITNMWDVTINLQHAYCKLACKSFLFGMSNGSVRTSVCWRTTLPQYIPPLDLHWWHCGDVEERLRCSSRVDISVYCVIWMHVVWTWLELKVPWQAPDVNHTTLGDMLWGL